MKLAWHIAKKDFRRLWPLLVLWWGVLVVRAFEPALDLANPYKDWAWWALNFDEIRIITIMAADTILLLLIGVAAIQTDSPIKPGAHWRTLPLAGGRALWAKILFFTVFCGLPAALINLSAKIAYGFPLSELFDGLVWLEWKIAVCLALGAILASLFRNPLLTSMVALVFYCCLSVLYELPGIWYIQVEGTGNSNGFTLYLTRFLVWSNLLLGAVIGTVVCVYYCRRRSWAWLTLAMGFICAQCAQGLWPYDFYPDDHGPGGPPPAPTPAPPAEISDLAVQFSPFELIRDENRKPGNQYSMKFNAVITGLHSMRPGETWLLSNGDWTLPLPDGQKMYFYAGSMSGDALRPVNYADVLQALGLEMLPENENVIKGGIFLYNGKNGNYGKTQGDRTLNLIEQVRAGMITQKLSSELLFTVGQMTRVADVPVTAGARIARTPDYFAIQQVRLTQDENAIDDEISASIPKGISPEIVLVDLLTQSVEPSGPPLGPLPSLKDWSDWSDWYGNPLDDPNSTRPEYFFVLWNPRRQEIVPGAWHFQLHPISEIRDPYGQNEGDGLSVDTSTRQIYFLFYKSGDATPWSAQEVQTWLADARLVELRFVPEHRYSARADVNHLEFPDHVTTDIPKVSNSTP